MPGIYAFVALAVSLCAAASGRGSTAAVLGAFERAAVAAAHSFDDRVCLCRVSGYLAGEVSSEGDRDHKKAMCEHEGCALLSLCVQALFLVSGCEALMLAQELKGHQWCCAAIWGSNVLAAHPAYGLPLCQIFEWFYVSPCWGDIECLCRDAHVGT